MLSATNQILMKNTKKKENHVSFAFPYAKIIHFLPFLMKHKKIGLGHFFSIV